MQSPESLKLDVSTDDPDAIAAIDQFAEDLLGMGPDTARVFEAAERYPECALLQVYAGILHLYAMTSPENRVANECFARARDLGGNTRELALLEAAQTWHDGHYESAMELCEDITRQWPRDVVAAKVAEFNYFLGGQHWNGYRFAAHMERILEANEDNPYLLGMHAFAQELSGGLDECLSSAKRATEEARRNPWAHHALAHLYTRIAEPGPAIAWLEDHKDTWHQSGSAIRVHNFWHLALLYLDQCDINRVRQLFEEEVFVRDREAVAIHTDAAALLWRLELAGEDVSTAWEPVAQACEARAGDFTIPYIAAHHAYVFARTGRQDALDQTLEKAIALQESSEGERRVAWREVGLPLLEGVSAFAAGDAKRGATKLDPVMTDVGRGGGSDAQIDLFRQTHLVATSQAGEHSQARQLWERRVGDRHPTALEERWREDFS